MSNEEILVEDNEDHALLAMLALEGNNISNKVTVVRDGQDAVDYLFGTGSHVGRSVNKLPALVLLDLKMPRLSGHDVLMRIRNDERMQLLPVVILTSSLEQSDVTSAYREGANSYIVKPTSFAEFDEAMKKIAVYWLRYNENPYGRL